MTSENIPEWEIEYRAALVETDPNILPGRIRKAEIYIQSRLASLQRSERTEAAALEDALRNLKILKREQHGAEEKK